VYGRVARLRRSWYVRRPHARRVLERPVVSVGNLVVGGSGKTPVVALLARLLLQAGERPSILSRGYARRRGVDGVLVVSDGAEILAPVQDSGDEPQMLARMLPRVPVVVCADRHLAGVVAERRFDCTVHILDDGFQHLQLARDVDLLLVDPRDLDERVLPAGRLREPPEAAGAADALLVVGTRSDAEEASAALGVRTTFTVVPHYGPARWLRGAIDEPGPAGGRVVAVTGIARPARFFNALRDLGWNVAREMPFPDHHWFTEADHARIAAAVRELSADGVITTEKDAVRLGSDPGTGRLKALSRPVPGSDPTWAVLPMEVSIEPAAEFGEWLWERVRRSPEPPGLVRRSPKGEGG
jgi:tetraacyldisaccharide 4'-kinase